MKAIDIQQEVADNLVQSGAGVSPSARLARLVNRAKDSVSLELELLNENLFTARETYDEIESGDESITLPSDFQRLIGLTRTDGSHNQEVIIIPYQDRRSHSATTDWPISGFTSDSPGNSAVMYREGNKLWFTSRDGAPSGIVLEMRFRRPPADIADSDTASSYDEIPEIYHNLIADLATAEALPMTNPNQRKYKEQYVAGVLQMRRSANRQIADKLPGIRCVDGY